LKREGLLLLSMQTLAFNQSPVKQPNTLKFSCFNGWWVHRKAWKFVYVELTGTPFTQCMSPPLCLRQHSIT
jgi:hypothetical protein